MARRKKLTIAQEVEKAAKLMQKLVRLKAADKDGYCTCVTCGKVDHYKNMQGGHFYSRRHLIFKLYIENCHPQCPGCNMYGMKTTKIQEAYRIYMEDMYGPRRIRAMQKLAWRAPPKFYRQDILDLQKEFRDQIKYHEQRIGL